MLLRIVNSVSYVSTINHDSHFAWQVQHLVTLDDAFCWFAHCKQRFMLPEDRSRELFFVAGAAFGDVGA